MPQQDTWGALPGGSSWELPQFPRGRVFHGLPPDAAAQAPTPRCIIWIVKLTLNYKTPDLDL